MTVLYTKEKEKVFDISCFVCVLEQILSRRALEDTSMKQRYYKAQYRIAFWLHAGRQGSIHKGIEFELGVECQRYGSRRLQALVCGIHALYRCCRIVWGASVRNAMVVMTHGLALGLHAMHRETNLKQNVANSFFVSVQYSKQRDYVPHCESHTFLVLCCVKKLRDCAA